MREGGKPFPLAFKYSIPMIWKLCYFFGHDVFIGFKIPRRWDALFSAILWNEIKGLLE